MTFTQKDSNNSRRRPTCAVIGGGAAGLFTAGRLGELGYRAVLYERNDNVGRKLAITGKGRCNLTNNCTPDEFLSNVMTNPRFLYAASRRFPPSSVIAFFSDKLRVPLKTERGSRVFPESDNAYDIVDALRRYASSNAMICCGEHITGVTAENGHICGVETGHGLQSFDAVIIATGGASYKRTGSDGDGYLFARSLGHTVEEAKPSLVPIEDKNKLCVRMQGLSLKNVGLSVKCGEKELFSDFGEMLFTHFGLSGPMVLSASSHMHGADVSKCTAYIDLKPALDEKTLDARLLSDFEKYSNRDFINALSDLLPAKIIEPVIEQAGIDKRKKVNSLTREERHALITAIKGFSVPLLRFRPIDEAIITNGGVNVREINPSTMGSKLVSGLFFAGEVMDVDAYTGGFNLQIAFSTAYLAADGAAAYLSESAAEQPVK